MGGGRWIALFASEGIRRGGRTVGSWLLEGWEGGGEGEEVGWMLAKDGSEDGRAESGSSQGGDREILFHLVRYLMLYCCCCCR